MWGQGPPKDNLESWQDIQQFIAEFPETPYWVEWKTMARQVICGLANLGLAPSFRIGQGMHHIMLSTLEHHGLRAEPRVTLDFDPESHLVRVAYSRSNIEFNEPLSEERVPVEAAVSAIIKNLKILWNETKPGVPMPAALIVL